MSGRRREQSFITLIKRRSPSLMKLGTPSTRGPVVTYVPYLWFPWQCEHTHYPHHHRTCILLPRYPPHTHTHNLSSVFHNRWTQCSRLQTPCQSVRIFPKCRLISAALECLPQLNMFINTFFFFLSLLLLLE